MAVEGDPGDRDGHGWPLHESSHAVAAVALERRFYRTSPLDETQQREQRAPSRENERYAIADGALSSREGKRVEIPGVPRAPHP